MQSRTASRSEPATFASFATFAPPFATPSPTEFDDTEMPRSHETSGEATSLDSLTRISKLPVPSALVFPSCLIDRLNAAHRSPLDFVRFSVVTMMGTAVEHGSGAPVDGSCGAGRDATGEAVATPLVDVGVVSDAVLSPLLQLPNAPHATTSATPTALARIATHRCYQPRLEDGQPIGSVPIT